MPFSRHEYRGHLAPPYIASLVYCPSVEHPNNLNHLVSKSRPVRIPPVHPERCRPRISYLLAPPEESLVDGFAFDAADQPMPITEIKDQPNSLDKEQPLRRRACRSTNHTDGQHPRKNAPMSTRPGTHNYVRKLRSTHKNSYPTTRVGLSPLIAVNLLYIYPLRKNFLVFGHRPSASPFYGVKGTTDPGSLETAS